MAVQTETERLIEISTEPVSVSQNVEEEIQTEKHEERQLRSSLHQNVKKKD